MRFPKPILLVPLFTLVVGLPLILSQRIPGSVAYDQKLYHYPAIVQFQESWPRVDMWHYLSATTPGYHIIMATVGHFGGGVMAMQCVSLLIAMLAGLLLAATVARFTTPWLAVVFCLPLLCREHFVNSSVWLLPDDIGWLGVIIMLRLALRDRQTLATLALAGLTLIGLVWVRQIHAWTAGVVWVAGWLAAAGDMRWPALREGAAAAMRSLVPAPARQTRTLLLAAACTLPGLLFVALFVRYWGGFVPPVFQTWYGAPNPAAWVFVLATFGAFGMFFLPVWGPAWVAPWKRGHPAAVNWVLLALLAALLPATTYDYASGRRSGLWNLVPKLPVIGHVSILMVGLATLGAAALNGLLSATPLRPRLILLAAITGFSAACTANHDLFQRYMDPFVLILLALLAGYATGVPKRRSMAAVMPLMLSSLLLSLTLRLATSNPDRISDPPPRASETGNSPAELPRPLMPPDKRFW